MELAHVGSCCGDGDVVGVPGQAARQWLAPEEVELQDVEREMERELIQQHAHADRVIAHRLEPDGTLRYLVKVGLFF